MELINHINDVKATFSNNKLVNVVFNINTTKDTVKKDKIFFGNIERNAYFDSDIIQNKNCLWSTDTTTIGSHLIRNLYSSDKCFFKSAIYDASKTSRTNTTYDFLNITNHKISADNALNKVIQVDNILYSLEPKTKYGRYNIKCDIYSYISSNTSYVLPPNSLISTAIYDINAICAAIENNSIEDLQKNAVSANLSNIQYNMIYEIPGNVYNDYESGNIAANTFKCKNIFNSVYNMEHDNTCVLKHARNYDNIDCCNKLVYLTYTDDICYADTTTDNTYIDSTGGYANIKCLHVEMLVAMNRYANLNGHKTNLYSIAVYTDIFKCLKNNNSSDIKTIKNNLKGEILHAVRNIVNKLQPINTQLLSVYINEV